MTRIEFETLLQDAEKLGYLNEAYLDKFDPENSEYLCLCDIQKWLWEKHEVWVAVCIEIMHELLFYYESINSENEYFSEEYHEAPTDALFSGLKHALTQLKK